MEFIPPIAASAHPRFEVPWFGPRNKVYTPEGLYSWLYYPQHEGYNIKHVIEGDFHGKTWAEAAGFVQHWAYWGMILEFFQISGLLGLENGLLRHGQEPDDGTATLRTFSASLPYLILLWQRVHTNPETPNAEEIELTRLFKIIVILKRVNQFYTLLCSRETARLGEKDEKDDKPRQAQPMFGRHSHKHEQPGSWDDNIKNRPSKRTFFTDEPYSGNSPFESPGHALILSIGVVGELLCWATERKYKRKIDKLNWTIPLTIIRRMNLAGWCPVWLRRLQDEGSIIRACYLSSIPRSPPDRHTKCCAFGCIANQVNVVTYQTKHRNEGCDCQMVSFDLGEQSECANWIKMGHTPLIVSVNGEWKLVRGRDVESDKMKKYVAMSHVWADGTGNANGNALPSCQLRKFQTAANQLYNKTSTNAQIPFWVDTICVPFTKGETKTLAIRQMEQIYRDADKVLVFDSGLQQITLDTRASECLTQIEISSWNERLWTIQEAAFAKMLYFQFKDAITSLVGLHQRYRLERFARLASFRYGMSSETDIRRIPLLDLILDTHLQPVLREKALVKPPGIDDGEWVALDADALAKSPCDTEMDGLQLDTVFLGTVLAVSTFFNTLQLLPTESKAAQQKWSFLEKVLPYRQTSIVSDEGLCIATLLKMDQSSLHDLPDEERMRRMFLHVGTINCGILFGDRTRLEQPGYRWMPSTFVSQRIAISQKNCPGYRIGSQGKTARSVCGISTRRILVDLAT
jgi:Heterokaryon incompatibility protein (HET)